MAMMDDEIGVTTSILTNRVDRLHYLHYLQNRWRGPMSLSIWLSPKDLDKVQRLLHKLHGHKEMVRVVLYITSGSSYYWKGSFANEKRQMSPKLYPINLLRDLAILNTVTSHYVNLDMDLWPSSSLREHFLNLPEEVLSDSRVALILPAFQFSPSIRHEYRFITSVNEE